MSTEVRIPNPVAGPAMVNWTGSVFEQLPCMKKANAGQMLALALEYEIKAQELRERAELMQPESSKARFN